MQIISFLAGSQPWFLFQVLKNDLPVGIEFVLFAPAHRLWRPGLHKSPLPFKAKPSENE